MQKWKMSLTWERFKGNPKTRWRCDRDSELKRVSMCADKQYLCYHVYMLHENITNERKNAKFAFTGIYKINIILHIIYVFHKHVVRDAGAVAGVKLLHVGML